MSDNDHVAAIRDYATEIRDDVNYTTQAWRQMMIAMRVDHIVRHADALAAQLAEAEARVKRLREAYLDAENDSVTYALPEHNAANPHRQVTERAWITAMREAHLNDGDLDEPEAAS